MILPEYLAIGRTKNMRVDEEQYTATRKVYIAKDGQKFYDEDACKHHEMILDGTRIVCPECHGKKGHQGKYIEPYDHWDGPMGGYYEWHECKRCKGKGYLEQKWE